MPCRVEETLGGLKDLGGTIVSDGWTDVSKRPLINVILGTPTSQVFIACEDTSGKKKARTNDSGKLL